MNQKRCARSGYVFAVGLNRMGLHIGRGFAESYTFSEESVYIPSLFEEALAPTSKQPVARVDLGPIIMSLSDFLVAEVPRRVWMDLDAPGLDAAADLLADVAMDEALSHTEGLPHHQVVEVRVRGGDGTWTQLYARGVERLGPSRLLLVGAFKKEKFRGEGGAGYCAFYIAERFIVEGASILARIVHRDSWMCVSLEDLQVVQGWLQHLGSDPSSEL